MKYFVVLFLVLFASCGFTNNEGNKTADPFINNASSAEESKVEKQDSLKLAYDFDFPVGKPDAKGYYNAQPFGKNNHLGDDWNAVTGGNSDLGDAIFSIAVGKVVFAEDLKGGWGKVIRLVHYRPNGLTYESVYAHCEKMEVTVGDWVKKGQKIGTIGNADGIYLAHLHFEIRDSVGMAIGGGYSENQNGYLNPTTFIQANREKR